LSAIDGSLKERKRQRERQELLDAIRCSNRNKTGLPQEEAIAFLPEVIELNPEQQAKNQRYFKALFIVIVSEAIACIAAAAAMQ
jgi:hypothetical protein